MFLSCSRGSVCLSSEAGPEKGSSSLPADLVRTAYSERYLSSGRELPGCSLHHSIPISDSGMVRAPQEPLVARQASTSASPPPADAPLPGPSAPLTPVSKQRTLHCFAFSSPQKPSKPPPLTAKEKAALKVVERAAKEAQAGIEREAKEVLKAGQRKERERKKLEKERGKKREREGNGASDEEWSVSGAVLAAARGS